MSLKENKDNADTTVAARLYQRALGHSHPAVKIYADPKTGDEIQVPYTQRYPPDTTACIFWIRNRQPVVWRDKVESTTTVQGPVGGPVQVLGTTPAQAIADLRAVLVG